jgi:hypothetical protein
VKSFFKDRIALSFAAMGFVVASLPLDLFKQLHWDGIFNNGSSDVPEGVLFAAVLASQFSVLPLFFQTANLLPALHLSETLIIQIVKLSVCYSAPFTYFFVGKFVALLRRKPNGKDASRAAHFLKNWKATAALLLLLEGATLFAAAHIDWMDGLVGYAIVSVLQFGAFFMLGNVICSFPFSGARRLCSIVARWFLKDKVAFTFAILGAAFVFCFFAFDLQHSTLSEHYISVFVVLAALPAAPLGFLSFVAWPFDPGHWIYHAMFTLGLSTSSFLGYYLIGRTASIILRMLRQRRPTVFDRTLNHPVCAAALFLAIEYAIGPVYFRMLYTLELPRLALLFIVLLQILAYLFLAASVQACLHRFAQRQS